MKKLQPIVEQINEIATRLQAPSEDELRGQTEKFRGILRDRTALEQELTGTRETKRPPRTSPSGTG